MWELSISALFAIYSGIRLFNWSIHVISVNAMTRTHLTTSIWKKTVSITFLMEKVMFMLIPVSFR